MIDGYYLIDRPPDLFQEILDFLRTGQFHVLSIHCYRLEYFRY